MTMFATASVNVIGFDPTRNTDQARSYASKYCSSAWPLDLGFVVSCYNMRSTRVDGLFVIYCILRKPEKFFYLETTTQKDDNQNSCKKLLIWI